MFNARTVPPAVRRLRGPLGSRSPRRRALPRSATSGSAPITVAISLRRRPVADRYVDGFYIQVGFISAPWDKEKYLDVFMQLPSGPVDFDELEKDMVALTWLAPDGARREDPLSFKSRMEHQHSSWGADGQAITYVLDVAAALGTPALYDGIKTLIRKYGNKREAANAQTYTDERFIQAAVQTAVRLTSSTHDAITATGIERSMSETDTAKVSLLKDGTQAFEITVRMIDGVPVCERVYRQLG